MSLSCNLKATQKVFFLELGTASSCCRALPEPIPPGAGIGDLIKHWQNEAGQLEQGQALHGCRVCWQDEARGQTSFRQSHVDYVSDDIEIFAHNACNQMCGYCSPKFSSTWENSIQQHGLLTKISKTAKQNLEIPVRSNIDVDSWINAICEHIQQQPPNTVRLALLGGEPLMQYKNLQRVVDLVDHLKLVTVNTNLNPPNNKFLVWLLERVPPEKLLMRISIDATPQFNHVPRALFDQSRFEHNLDLVKQHGANIRVISTLSVLSLFDFHNFLTWIDQNQLNQSVFKVNNPACLSPEIVPRWLLDRVTNQFGYCPKIIADLVDTHREPVDLKYIEQYNYISQYFTRTGIDPTAVSNDMFADWWQWLTQKAQK